MDNLLNKVILLSVVCFLSTPIAEFIAENFGSIIGNLFTITRTAQYASSIRMICLILFFYAKFMKNVATRLLNLT